MSRSRFLLALPLAALAAACATGPEAPLPAPGPVQSAAPGRVDINPGHALGRLAAPAVAVPTLEQMMEARPSAGAREGVSDEDRLRAPALRDAALSYGARGGLAWASQQINRMLEERSAELSRTYDFNSFLIAAPGGVTVLPPVISESRDTYEQFDAGKALRVADTYYEIIAQARFAPVAPLWHTYLIRSYTAPEPPQDALLPKNDGERDLWRRFVAEGWAQGVRQAQDIFRNDIRRLERDFTGMVRYAELLERGQVSAPVIAEAHLGVTGTGEDMRVNDRTLRITADPRLQVPDPGAWRAPVSGLTPTAAAAPPGS